MLEAYYKGALEGRQEGEIMINKQEINIDDSKAQQLREDAIRRAHIEAGAKFCHEYLYVVESIKHIGIKSREAIRGLEDYVYQKSVLDNTIIENNGRTNQVSDPTAKFAALLNEQKEMIISDMSEELQELQSKWRDMKEILAGMCLTIEERKVFDFKYGDWYGERHSNVWIAVRMGVDEGTVRNREKSLFEKIGQEL